MTTLDILGLRLHNQHLAGPLMNQPENVVSWLGAVQAQDYPGAKWAIAQRTKHPESIDQAFAEGKILRTHIMRPTWHLVAAKDIRWLMALTAPRVRAAMAYNNRQLKLNDAVFAKTNKIIAQVLRGGQQLTRAELGDALKQAGIDLGPSPTLCLAHIIMTAELDALICSGAMRSKQHTYALLEERAPAAKTLTRQQSLAELARRYFTSHGPATVKDYAWWSGLTVADAKAGLQAVQTNLTTETVDGQTYWYHASNSVKKSDTSKVYLLPNYDEYVVAYKDRTALFDTTNASKLDARRNPLFNNVITVGGQIAGTWKPVTSQKTVTVQINTFAPLKMGYSKNLASAIKQYTTFIEH